MQNNLDEHTRKRIQQLTLDSERQRLRDDLTSVAEYSGALHNRLVKLVIDSANEDPTDIRMDLEAVQAILQEVDARLDVLTVRTLIMQACR